ncbi:MAG: hypothetical protein M1840_001269 [Geoglossum simile]|nr:MAG: hypothetical protein M1840_001269 [Geoglossum simile]
MPWTVRDLEKTEDVLHRARDNLQKASDFDRPFGTVFATSGYKISPRIGCSLDWALVDVESIRLGENKIPEFPGKPLGYDFLSERDVVSSMAPLTLDDHVVKAGSTSRTTYGRVSHIKHDCNIPGNGSITSEYVVVGQKGRPFAFQGDSGAFVVNGNGKLAGILIAGQDQLGTAYVTPITEVMRDIQEVTGHEVTLP